MGTIKQKIRFWSDSIINSYAQIFFSLDKPLGILILLITFISPYLGACGLCAVILINIMAKIFGYTPSLISEGIYGFNALLLGLSLGYEYKFNTEFAIVFFSAVLILLMFTVMAGKVLGSKGLPFLSLPFLFTYWLVYLACGSFSFINLQEQYIYVENYVANQSQSPVYVFAHSLDSLELPLLIKSFLKTLSATFFQNSLLAGILIAGTLLYFSRIAFTLSFLGFATAFLTFKLLGVDTVYLTDFLVGSNFIFFAIGIGCFYVVPSKWSYLAVILLMPVLVIFYISLYKLLIPFQIKSFTLSFSLLTIFVLYILKHRRTHRFLYLVSIQYYSAEKTIYKHLTATRRFMHSHLAKFQLPFWGKWKVSQGYHGDVTHLGEWAHALDFIITGDDQKTYRQPGTRCEDFYAYNKPVIAPHDGFIYDIINNVDDNEIGKVNTVDNWGNSVIINHSNGLFTQISHLKRDSFKVKKGEFVTKGTILASCGNSGRSPEPHIHFQIQLSPKLGSATYPYPIAYFMQQSNDGEVLKTFEVPAENAVISNVEVAELLKNAYDFSPGKTIVMTDDENSGFEHEWKIYTDAYNRTYIYCSKTNSTVWFVNDGVMFYCYDFEGNTKSLLFDFYLAHYKILLAVYPHLKITDAYPIIHFNRKIIRIIQDFTAPFFIFTKAEYETSVTSCDNPIAPKQVELCSIARGGMFKKYFLQKEFRMLLTNNSLQKFTVQNHNLIRSYSCRVF